MSLTNCRLTVVLVVAVSLLSHLVATAAPSETAPLRVYCFFDVEAGAQRQRAADLQRAVGAMDGIEWIAVGRDGAVTAQETRSIASLLARPASLSAAAHTWLGGLAAATTDEVLIERCDSGWAVTGPGTEAAQLLRAAGLPAGGVATDVGFTTWGKVKDLFR